MTSTAKRVLAVLASAMMSVGVIPASPAAAAPDWICKFDAEYAHISSSNLKKGQIDIKVGATGECTPSARSVKVTGQVALEKEVFPGVWRQVAIGAAITKNLLGMPQVWRRNELMVVMKCEEGWFRGHMVSFSDDPTEKSPSSGYSKPQYMNCKPHKNAMVIDDTGSMGGVIGSVKAALSAYISSQPEDEYTSWNLTTFKDSPRTVGTTEDRDQVLGWVAGLSASGGGDCPEDVLGGISSGLASLGTDPKADKQMIVATDASAQAGDVNGIIAAAQAGGVRVNVLLTGDCDEPAGLVGKQGPVQQRLAAADPLSSQVVLKKIAEATGGKYFFLPEGSTDDFTDALNEIFTAIAHPTPTATPTTTRRPTNSASPTAGPAAPGDPGLPVTGANIVALLAAGAALLAAGAVLLLRFRRRRLTETL
jgi:LPXTG-motif cell wall-anchored protein